MNTERILELHRPPHCLPRAESVFMVADPAEIDFAGGYEHFVYEVVAEGPVEKNDMDWYSRISVYIWDDRNDREAKALAAAYWSGRPSDRSEGSLFEFRARSAMVRRLAEEN